MRGLAMHATCVSRVHAAVVHVVCMAKQPRGAWRLCRGLLQSACASLHWPALVVGAVLQRDSMAADAGLPARDLPGLLARV